MATNTGKRKCKHCGTEFIKKSPLHYLCSPKCEKDYNAGKKRIPSNSTIKKYSDKNKFSCSDGTKISSLALSKLVTKAKAVKTQEMLDNYGYIFCEDCDEFGHPPGPINEMELKIIDCSHNISEKEAKESGRAELCHDVDNIRMRCRIHHKIHDKTT